MPSEARLEVDAAATDMAGARHCSTATRLRDISLPGNVMAAEQPDLRGVWAKLGVTQTAWLSLERRLQSEAPVVLI
jgi:hypothetical protein